jgi:hypothetical protein
MIITLRVDGGFACIPGLSNDKIIDTTTLPQADAAKLEKMVEAAAVFALPKVVGVPPQGSADMLAYELSIEDGNRMHRLRVNEPIADHALENLIQFLQEATNTVP